jgi:hypothetical protein
LRLQQREEHNGDPGGTMETPRPGSEGAELVRVFDTEMESEAMVVRGLLEANGIEVLMTGLDAPQDVLPGVGGIILSVRPEQADEARGIIQRERAAPALDENSDVSGGATEPNDQQLP